ncbi:MAG TPA: hypothetical protein PK514_14450 [Spirochaetota bacterium]|nr:hypothetical protein [Spirochaetota bacterium]
MELRRIIPVILLLSFLSCGKVPQSLTNGEWQYDLIVNGVRAGSAVISNCEKDGLLVSRTEMFISLGTMKNTTTQTVTETKEFRPVRLEVVSTLEDSSSGSRQVISRIAEFNGNNVTLDSDGKKARYTLTGPFIIDGNFFTDSLVKGRFREGMEIRAKLYEPTVTADKTILVIVNAAGRENVTVRGKELKLIHVRQRVEKLKSVDIYLDDTGVTEKMVIKMLNNIFEMERID